jgi:hypothetical protein
MMPANWACSLEETEQSDGSLPVLLIYCAQNFE